MIQYRNYIVIISFFWSFVCNAQNNLKNIYFSFGLDPKIALIGTDNKDTSHPAGLNYLGKFGLDWKGPWETFGYLESYEDIGYRGIGIGQNYQVFIGRLEFLAGFDWSIISRKETTDHGLNTHWQEYLPSLGVNGEFRYHFNQIVGIGWQANYRSRPDLPSLLGRLSGYINLYIKI
ncbi:hypothetical protein [Nonlabens xiamenensis]|uniref:hypothetical protein n=1 Tax=Nonlabens xiamenensis TaxID=2341043 RepID=UPI000F60F10B|nr:hypothetical protein [Nonlabens xiamenensis]